ncbi:hypothetical protein K2173_016868 [Erythroxylum novogranatense]|uniref:Glycosyltransferase n=1 Tax=Erythroxylum novogranatense TaxID=1862640 RepID=A0AAV8U531_9ROSI|nr:hypothetical protein K2173_016868 [Erythroxylum novogranatense]
MSSNQHIVMLPVMAHGHLIPFLALARRIYETTGFTITIANTPLNIQHLRSTSNSSLPGDEPPRIQFAELPFCSVDHGLPPNTENTENLSLEQIGRFFCATLDLKSPFRQLLSDITATEGKPPLCVISDFFFGWANEVAHSVGTVNLTFSTSGAYGMLADLSVWLNLPHRRVADSYDFSVPGFPDEYRFHTTQLHQFIRKADGTDSWSKFLQPQLSLSMKSLGWLCNTVEEIEPLSVEWLRNYIKVPVWPIGPLFPTRLLKRSSSTGSSLSSASHSGKQPGISLEKCLKWLDLQSPGSVLYISFGSQNTITASQMMELATGLEEAGKPFIWVIRAPIGFDRRGEFKAEWLPDGFEQRMSNTKRGLLVKNWASQLEILCHKSTGVFLSHCGWNSVMESLSQGVPIIGWPMAAEQAYNSKMLVEEMGVSVELTRGIEGHISAKQVKESIDLAMDKNSSKGLRMKKNAVEMEKQIREAISNEGEKKGSSIRAMDDLFKTLICRSLKSIN